MYNDALAQAIQEKENTGKQEAKAVLALASSDQTPMDLLKEIHSWLAHDITNPALNARIEIYLSEYLGSRNKNEFPKFLDWLDRKGSPERFSKNERYHAEEHLSQLKEKIKNRVRSNRDSNQEPTSSISS